MPAKKKSFESCYMPPNGIVGNRHGMAQMKHNMKAHTKVSQLGKIAGEE